MPKAKRTYGWDSSVVIAWLTQEQGAPLKDMAMVLQEVYEGKATLVISSMTYGEVLRAKQTPDQLAAFDGFLKRSGVIVIDASVRVMRKAAEIRSRGIELPKEHESRKIKTPDAAIIATAVLAKVDMLHSLEPKHKNLSGTAIVDGLRIGAPGLLKDDGQVQRSL